MNKDPSFTMERLNRWAFRQLSLATPSNAIAWFVGAVPVKAGDRCIAHFDNGFGDVILDFE